MIQFQGGDPHRMRSAAHQLEAYAADLRRRTAAITADVDGGVWWRGSDADRFRSDWHSLYAQLGDRVSRELAGMAAYLREAAAAQEAISQC